MEMDKRLKASCNLSKGMIDFDKGVRNGGTMNERIKTTMQLKLCLVHAGFGRTWPHQHVLVR